MSAPGSLHVTLEGASELVQPVSRPRAGGATERQRRRRALQAVLATPQPIIFERPDWGLFLDLDTLPQKAGCQPDALVRAALKELTDNALDVASDVSLRSYKTDA